MGDVTNGGTIAGREVVKIDAANIQNLGGRISGGQVDLKAAQDINNIGGTIDAATRLSLQAGRDVRVITTTTAGASTAPSSAAGANIPTQRIGRIARLYVTEVGGQLSVKAGQDVILQGAGSKRRQCRHPGRAGHPLAKRGHRAPLLRHCPTRLCAASQWHSSFPASTLVAMRARSRFVVRAESRASLTRALLVIACVCLASGCDVGSKPEPPYKDPPPNQRIKSQVLLVHWHAGDFPAR